MKARTHARIHTPIVGRVAALNKYILSKRSKAKKAVQYNYTDDLLKQCYLLFKYALRELSGKDYIRRTTELCEEIQASAYLIAVLGGFTKAEAAYIDIAVDEILDEIVRVSGTSEPSHEERWENGEK